VLFEKKKKKKRKEDEVMVEDGRSVVRLEYLPRRSCRDGLGGRERGRGDSDPSQKRRGKENTRRPWVAMVETLS